MRRIHRAVFTLLQSSASSMQLLLFCTCFALTFSLPTFAQSKSGAISVKVIDAKTGKVIPDAVVRWYDHRYAKMLPGILGPDVNTEGVNLVDGKTHRAHFQDILPGNEYEIRASSVGRYGEERIPGIKVKAGKTTNVTIALHKTTVRYVIRKSAIGQAGSVLSR